MASSKDYLQYVLEYSSELSYRKMMGEYLIYYKGVLIGGIYDDRFLLKITPTVQKIGEDVKRAIPYDGGKEMIMIENLDDKDFTMTLIQKVYEDLK
ncbi:MAG: hypothetical protein IJF76_03170 [Clostridia bacterium]|nr:hypothetical protein [Clostridia bacterium]